MWSEGHGDVEWGARGRLCNTEKTSSDFTASYYTDDSDCEGYVGGRGEGGA